MRSKLIYSLLMTLTLSLFPAVQGDEAEQHQETVRKTTAVALNYCRAALHRIRRYPQKNVFYEEQTRILNNLNLNQIEDPEVISLYKSILDEISHVEINERERVVINEQFRRSIHRQLGTSFFVIGAQVATGQLGNVIQSGANSWWDYRNQEIRRDSDEWKVEKTEFTNLMSRSSTFLDSFWRLSQKNNIPDQWLIRDQDLDQLGRVLNEPNPEQRLRMLVRMERFMECYPPYWYYVARTQQHLGLTDEALQTFQRLSSVGSGHFRQDDMLASCMANMALLQELNNDPQAPQTAARVLDYSMRNWESNLICAWVLGRHRDYDTAEELILCNLDEDQEAGQSRVALVSLYYHSENRPKLVKLLNDERVVRDVPIPGLLLCARLLGADTTPDRLQTFLASTLSASVRRAGRSHALTLAASPAWKIQDARPEIAGGGQQFHSVGYRPGATSIHADFVTESHDDAAEEPGSLRVILNYPGTPAIHITLNPPAPPSTPPPAVSSLPQRIPFGYQPAASRLSLFQRNDVHYQIESIELDGLRLSFHESETVPQDASLKDGNKEVSIEEDLLPVTRS